MFCKECGKEIYDSAKFCEACGAKVNSDIEINAESAEITSDENTNAEIILPLIFEVSRGSDEGKLQCHSDKIVFDYTRKNMSACETYHYFNIKNIEVDNMLKVLNLSVQTVDDEKQFFEVKNVKSQNEYAQIAEQINSVRKKCPSLEELNLNSEEMVKELQENKEMRKSDTYKKIGSFFGGYKNFGSLSLVNKIIHVALPLLIVVFAICIFSGESSASDEQYFSSAQTVISQQLKAPSTASYSDMKIVDRDHYGRVLVTMAVDAQNGFGAYVRSYYAIVIKSYDTKTDKFVYYPNAVKYWTNSALEEAFIESAKDDVNWNEPLEED